MQTLTLGEITFVAGPTGLEVRCGAAAEQRFAITMDQAGDLEEFLRRNLPRERRIGFRVRIAPLADRVREAFQVRLDAPSATADVQPVDLSLTGILVEGRGLGLCPGMEVPVSLKLDGRHCMLSGTVVRAQGNLVALHFVESMDGGELTPPEGLLSIYRRLETEWLRSRID